MSAFSRSRVHAAVDSNSSVTSVALTAHLERSALRDRKIT
jgi:hypothetical protein